MIQSITDGPLPIHGMRVSFKHSFVDMRVRALQCVEQLSISHCVFV